LATVTVFGLTGIQPKPATIEIYLLPTAGENFRLNAPAGYVGDTEYGLEVSRQFVD
jgi:hypothetical protein